MDKINILIIEDDPDEASVIVELLVACNYNIAGVAATHKDALVLFYKVAVDIVIIDVFLNGNPDGITFAETISTVPNAIKPFVFLTSSKDRQIFERARLTKPYSFLLKPFNVLEVCYAIEMAIEKFYMQTNVFSSETQNTVVSNEYLFIKKKNALKKVLLSDIIYIEVDERYCHIVTEKEKFVIQIALRKLAELLNDKIFVKTHRNYLVNINAIEELVLSDNIVFLKGNHSVTISDNYKDFLKRFNILK